MIYIHIFKGSERRIWCFILASICRNSRVLYKWVCRNSPAWYASLFRVLHNTCMSHANESGHWWMCRITYDGAHTADSLVCYTSLRHVAYDRPHMTLTHEWVVSLMNESVGYECHIHAMKSVTWLIHTWDYSLMCDIHMWRDTFICVTWLIQVSHGSFTCDMTHSCVTWLINVWDSYVTWRLHAWYDSFTCDMPHLRVTWLIHAQHDSFILVPWRGHACLLLHAWHDSFICDMTLHTCMLTYARLWHDSPVRDMTHTGVTRLIHVWHHAFLCDMT